MNEALSNQFENNIHGNTFHSLYSCIYQSGNQPTDHITKSHDARERNNL